MQQRKAKAGRLPISVTMTREAAALFDDAEPLERAVSELQSRGFDRADLSFLAHRSTEAGAHEAREPIERLADNPNTPREAATTTPDIRQQRLFGTSLAATIAGFAAAGFTVATGGVLAAVVVATAAAAGGVGAIGAMIGRRLEREEAAHLDAQLAKGGVILWVNLADAAAEERALQILRRHCEHVAVHEYPTDPRDRKGG